MADKWTPERAEPIITARRNGLPVKQIAAEFRETPDSIKHVLRKYDVRVGPPSAWPPERVARLRTLLNAGMPIIEISARMGLQPSSLYEALPKVGLKPHRTYRPRRVT